MFEQFRILIAVVVLAASFGAGWLAQGWRRDSLDLKEKEDAAELARENRRGANTAATGHETDKERLRVEFQTITETVEKIVEKPIYRNVCLDSDGLRALSAAIENRPAASESSGAVPGPDAAQ